MSQHSGALTGDSRVFLWGDAGGVLDTSGSAVPGFATCDDARAASRARASSLLAEDGRSVCVLHCIHQDTDTASAVLCDATAAFEMVFGALEDAVSRHPAALCGVVCELSLVVIDPAGHVTAFSRGSATEISATTAYTTQEPLMTVPSAAAALELLAETAPAIEERLLRGASGQSFVMRALFSVVAGGVPCAQHSWSYIGIDVSGPTLKELEGVLARLADPVNSGLGHDAPSPLAAQMALAAADAEIVLLAPRSSPIAKMTGIVLSHAASRPRVVQRLLRCHSIETAIADLVSESEALAALHVPDPTGPCGGLLDAIHSSLEAIHALAPVATALAAIAGPVPSAVTMMRLRERSTLMRVCAALFVSHQQSLMGAQLAEEASEALVVVEADRDIFRTRAEELELLLLRAHNDRRIVDDVIAACQASGVREDDVHALQKALDDQKAIADAAHARLVSAEHELEASEADRVRLGEELRTKAAALSSMWHVLTPVQRGHYTKGDANLSGTLGGTGFMSLTTLSSSQMGLQLEEPAAAEPAVKSDGHASAALTVELVQLRSLNRTLRRELSEANEEAQESLIHMLQLRSDLRIAEDALRVRSTEVAQLSMLNDAAGQRTQLLEQQLGDLELELQAHVARHRSQERQLRTAKEDWERIRGELLQAEKVRSDLQLQLSEVLEVQRAADMQNGLLNATIREIEADKLAMTRFRDDATAKVADLERRLRDMQPQGPRHVTRDVIRLLERGMKKNGTEVASSEATLSSTGRQAAPKAPAPSPALKKPIAKTERFLKSAVLRESGALSRPVDTKTRQRSQERRNNSVFTTQPSTATPAAAPSTPAARSSSRTTSPFRVPPGPHAASHQRTASASSARSLGDAPRRPLVTKGFSQGPLPASADPSRLGARAITTRDTAPTLSELRSRKN